MEASMDGASGSHDRGVQESIGEESRTGSEIWKVEGREPMERKLNGKDSGALSKPSVSAEGAPTVEGESPMKWEDANQTEASESLRKRLKGWKNQEEASQEGLTTTESLILAQDERWRRA